MMRIAFRRLAATCGLLAALYALPAEAGRVALVVGNAEYKTGVLRYPAADAAAVAHVFERQLKFDKVILGENLGRKAFGAALQEVARGLSGAGIGVLYFVGRGVEDDGRILLLPVDADLAALDEAVPLDNVLDHLAGASKLRMVVLDVSWDIAPRRGRPARSDRDSLMLGPGRDALVVVATKPGATVVQHADGRRSAFTEAFLKHVLTPGLDVRLLFGNVRDDVLMLTDRRQQPFIYGNLGREPVYLNPPAR
jgi:uncharacterized caspase-like protein